MRFRWQLHSIRHSLSRLVFQSLIATLALTKLDFTTLAGISSLQLWSPSGSHECSGFIATCPRKLTWKWRWLSAKQSRLLQHGNYRLHSRDNECNTVCPEATNQAVRVSGWSTQLTAVYPIRRVVCIPHHSRETLVVRSAADSSDSNRSRLDNHRAFTDHTTHSPFNFQHFSLSWLAVWTLYDQYNLTTPIDSACNYVFCVRRRTIIHRLQGLFTWLGAVCVRPAGRIWIHRNGATYVSNWNLHNNFRRTWANSIRICWR